MQPPDFGEAHERAREPISESEERFRLLVEGVKDYAIFMLDAEGYVTTWNSGAKRINGYEAAEIVGEHFSIFYTDEDVERGHPEEVLRVATAEGSYQEEGIRVRKDGSAFWADLAVTALRDEEGNLRGFAKVTRDITARKEAEELERLLALEQGARERATDILESISDAFFAVDRGWRFTYINSKAEELWGRSREDLLGKNLWEEFPRADGSESYRQIRRAMEEGRTTEFEAISPVLGVWVAGRAYPSREGLSVYFQDVTERKRAEETLRENHVLLNSVLEGTTEAVFVKDLQCRYLLANSRAAEVIGRPTEELLGKSDADLLPPEVARSLIEADRRVMESGEAITLEEEVPVEGELRTFLSTKSPYRDHRGEVAGVIGVATDITERKRYEEAIGEVRADERRRIARDLHDGVLQDLSYSTAAMGLMMLEVEDTALEEELQKMIDALRRSAQGLRDAVNDLRLDEERERPFTQLVESVVRRSRSKAEGCEICLAVEEEFPAAPLGETGTQLSRVIQEAITNALRHSGAQRISVSLKVDGGELLAEISDDGRGFGPETAPGIGLNGMRERAALIGADLEVESEPRGGTRVRARVPLPRGTRG